LIKIAAYQAPLLECGAPDAINLICKQVGACEAAGVEILCCPEAVLGGLADYHPKPYSSALNAEDGQLNAVLAPLASDTVTTIVGFTEVDRRGRLFNSAAVFHKGSIVGLYRKIHPAINRSIYQPGDRVSVFTLGDLTFGILICNDSNYPELARLMTAQGATALFVPTNNGLPPAKGGPGLVDEARKVDITCALKNGVSVIRADVAGRLADFVSYGSSAIIASDGNVITTASLLEPDLIVAEIDTRPTVVG
jgi:predicted amidohydrolase